MAAFSSVPPVPACVNLEKFIYFFYTFSPIKNAPLQVTMRLKASGNKRCSIKHWCFGFLADPTYQPKESVFHGQGMRFNILKTVPFKSATMFSITGLADVFYTAIHSFLPPSQHWHDKEDQSSLLYSNVFRSHLFMMSWVQDVTSQTWVKELLCLRVVSCALTAPPINARLVFHSFAGSTACRMSSTVGLSRGFLHGWKRRTDPVSFSKKSPPIWNKNPHMKVKYFSWKDLRVLCSSVEFFSPF